MSTMTSINTTASSLGGDTAIYGNSARAKELLSIIDGVINQGESHYRQQLSRMLIKPLNRRVKKSDINPISDVCDNVLDDFRQRCQKEMDELIEESEIKQKLYVLDELIARETNRGNVQESRWRPCGRAASDLRVYELLRQIEYRDQLIEMSKIFQRETTAGQTEIERERKEIYAAEKELSAISKKLRRPSAKAETKTEENKNPDARRTSKSSNMDLEKLRRDLMSHLKEQ